MSENKLNAGKRMKRKPWPRDCIWPEPLKVGEGMQWEDELTDHMNLLKIDAESYTKDPAMFVRDTIGYEFINENLLRQAFTRRAFAVEYGLPGCNEELEFLGDTVLNTVVTRDMLRHNGLWIDLKEAGITPELENSINQLQELYQKKYLEQLPVYDFTEEDGDSWYCICRCNGVAGTGYGARKTKAKKVAAYMVLRNLFHAAGMK